MYFSTATDETLWATQSASKLISPRLALKLVLDGQEQLTEFDLSAVNSYFDAYRMVSSALDAGSAVDAAVGVSKSLASRAASYAATALATSLWYNTNYGMFAGLAAIAPGFLGLGPPGALVFGVSFAATTAVAQTFKVGRRGFDRKREIKFLKVALDTCCELAEADGEMTPEEQKLLLDIARSLRPGDDFNGSDYLANTLEKPARGEASCREFKLKKRERKDLYALWVSMVHADLDYCGDEGEAVERFLTALKPEKTKKEKGRVQKAEQQYQRGHQFSEYGIQLMHWLSQGMRSDDREKAWEIMDVNLVASFPHHELRLQVRDRVLGRKMGDLSREQFKELSEDFRKSNIWQKTAFWQDADEKALEDTIKQLLEVAAQFVATVYGPVEEVPEGVSDAFGNIAETLGADVTTKKLLKTAQKHARDLEKTRLRIEENLADIKCPECDSGDINIKKRGLVHRNRLKCSKCHTEFFQCRLSVFGCDGTLPVGRVIHGELCDQHWL